VNLLTVNRLSKIIRTDQELLKILDQIQFELEEQSFTTLIGPSGSGKSTLLRIIAGLIKPTSGGLIWKENDQTPISSNRNKKPTISFVFQGFGLFPFLTVRENIEFGLKMKGMSVHKREAAAKNLIAEVELTGFEDKHPNELSGGMKQRVGIARALAMEPELLLLDEPFSALDEFTAENLRKLLLKLWKDRKFTILMVTHLISEAIELSDTVIALTSLPGRVQNIIHNPLHRPRSKRTQEFFKMEDKLQEILKV
jgi:NitT/TauT family transport system ATP-binding protein